MPTPWAAYVTPEPELFSVFPLPLGFVVSTDEGPSCRLSGPEQKIYLREAKKGSRPKEVKPYRLKLKRWDRKQGMPCVRLHAFAFAHLIVTGQVPREPILRLAWSAQEKVAVASTPITKSCELATMLGVSHFVVQFATHCDLAVVLRG